MSTIVITTVIAWSLDTSARNICFTEGAFRSTVDFSLMFRQVMSIMMTNNTAIINANHWKPHRSTSLVTAAASVFPRKSFPRAGTAIMVMTVISADPTPAQDLASVVRFSLSLPLSVKAGIMDQNGISIMV